MTVCTCCWRVLLVVFDRGSCVPAAEAWHPVACLLLPTCGAHVGTVGKPNRPATPALIPTRPDPNLLTRSDDGRFVANQASQPTHQPTNLLANQPAINAPTNPSLLTRSHDGRLVAKQTGIRICPCYVTFICDFVSDHRSANGKHCLFVVCGVFWLCLLEFVCASCGCQATSTIGCFRPVSPTYGAHIGTVGKLNQAAIQLTCYQRTNPTQLKPRPTKLANQPTSQPTCLSTNNQRTKQPKPADPLRRGRTTGIRICSASVTFILVFGIRICSVSVSFRVNDKH